MRVPTYVLRKRGETVRDEIREGGREREVGPDRETKMPTRKKKGEA